MSAAPPELEAFWQRVDEELACQPALPVLEPMPRHSSADFSVYSVRLTSLGPYRIFAVLSVPLGDGPFPALLEIPRYGSVNNVPHWNDRLRYVVLTLMHRGQRRADQPYAAAYPGLLTDGIERAEAYVFRGIVGDCLRAAEFLLARPEVDLGRVALRGNDLAVITAARRRGFCALHLESTLFYRAIEARHLVGEYPLEELNDYLRAAPGARAAVEATLSLFDPLHLAGAVRAATLVNVGDDGALDGRPWLDPLLDAFAGPVEQYRLTHRGGVDADRVDEIVAHRLGRQPMRRFVASAR